MMYDKESVNDLFIKYRKGDEEAKNLLVNNNIPLVWSLVNRYSHSYYDKEDLFQIGCLGLLKAIEKFDLSFDVQFSTYAVPIILGEIKKFFRDDGAMKVSRGLKELNIKINKFKDEFYNQYHREPRLEEIASKMNITSNDIIMAMEANYYPTSLSEIIYDDEESSIDLEARLAVDNVQEKIDLMTLKDELAILDEKEKLLINLRYYQDMNQEEIAKRFGVSQVQVSRLEKKIIEKLRKQFI